MPYIVVTTKEQKVVPLSVVDSEPIARTLTNTLKNQQYDCLIFQGCEENLKQFSQAITQVKISGLSPEQVKNQIVGLGDNFKLSLKDVLDREVNVEHIISNLQLDGFSQYEAAKVVSFTMENEREVTVGNYRFGYADSKFYDNTPVLAVPLPDAVKQDFDPVRGPGKTTYPKRLKEGDEYRKLWQWVFKNHSDEIKKSPDLFTQWVIACLILNKAAAALKINPWNLTEDPDSSEIRLKVIHDNEMADDFIDKLYSKMKEESLVTSISDESFETVVQEGDKYTASTHRKLTVGKNSDSGDVLRYLANNFAFKKVRSLAVKRITPLTVVEFEQNGDSLVNIWVRTSLATFNAQNLVEDKIFGDDLAQKVKKLFRVWFETGKLKFRKKDL